MNIQKRSTLEWWWRINEEAFKVIGPFYYYGLTLINTMFYKVWDEVTHLFPNFNGAAAEVKSAAVEVWG